MKESVDKSNESQKETVQKVSQESSNGGTAQFGDNRSSIAVQLKLQDSMGSSGDEDASPIQLKVNKTGLPDNLKSGIENLSGHSMDDVKVHYNSSKPAQLQAHAYAQGTDIHLGSGQEKHLPHEAWHVVQQKQGRVKPTRQLKSKVNINDDAGLEKEADVMGEKALSQRGIMNPIRGYHGAIRSRDTIQSKKVTQLELDGTAEGARIPLKTYRQAIQEQRSEIEEQMGAAALNAAISLKVPTQNLDTPKMLTRRSQGELTIDRCKSQVTTEGITSGAIDEIKDLPKYKNYNARDFMNLGVQLFNDEVTKEVGIINEKSEPENQVINADVIKGKLTGHQGTYANSHFVSTTTKPEYLYAVHRDNQNKPNQYYLFTIIEAGTDDRVYNMHDTRDPKVERDPESFTEMEAEIDFVGAIRPDQIIWAIAIPMIYNNQLELEKFEAEKRKEQKKPVYNWMDHCKQDEYDSSDDELI